MSLDRGVVASRFELDIFLRLFSIWSFIRFRIRSEGDTLNEERMESSRQSFCMMKFLLLEKEEFLMSQCGCVGRLFWVVDG